MLCRRHFSYRAITTTVSLILGCKVVVVVYYRYQLLVHKYNQTNVSVVFVVGRHRQLLELNLT